MIKPADPIQFLKPCYKDTHKLHSKVMGTFKEEWGKLY